MFVGWSENVLLFGVCSRVVGLFTFLFSVKCLLGLTPLILLSASALLLCFPLQVTTFRQLYSKVINDKHDDVMAKFGAILAQGILDAGEASDSKISFYHMLAPPGFGLKFSLSGRHKLATSSVTLN